VTFRRIVAIVLGIAALGGGVLWWTGRHVGVADLPTGHAGPVILISIDTLRADRLPIYGSNHTVTPALDRLAADGVVFDNAYAHSPQTLPSHTSILSGELPFAHGVRDNIGFTAKNGQRFLQHHMKDAGYATAAFVSSYVLRRQTGLQQGFDQFDDMLPQVSPEQPLGQVQRRGEETIEAAIKWIDAQTSNRVFIFAHIYEPHTPYAPPERFRKADPYDGEVEYADEIVGRLIAHLRTKGWYDDALIVLVSDHGEGLGDHGEEEHGIFLYRETIRVPLVIKLPTSAGAGRRVADPVQHVDLVATVMDLVGGPAATGRSLVPVLTGTGPLPPTNIYSESLSPRYHFGWSELYALSDDRYRLIRAPKDELYDLTHDARELSSVAADRPQVRAAMRSALDTMIAGSSVTAPSAVSDEDRQKLAALGYVGTQTGSAVSSSGDQLPDPKDKIQVLRMYREASHLASAGKFDEAVRVYRAVLREDGGMTDVRLRLATIHENQGQFPEAIAAYREVISRDPKSAAALTGISSALMRAGRLDEAKAHAELATAVAPAIAHELLARLEVHQRNPVAARRHADLAQQADPTLPMRAFIDGMILHGQGQFAEAAPRLLEAKRLMASRTEQVADVNYLAADSLARLERYQEAEELFKAEIVLFPAHIRARGGLAMLYKARGRDAEAAHAIEEIVRVSPTDEGVNLAAQLWTMFGEPRKAAEVRRLVRR
jgi:arylsulfatase A-like enzyme/tetratricopeptide (TPR) repeat protein